jgi:hypothetical protein
MLSNCGVNVFSRVRRRHGFACASTKFTALCMEGGYRVLGASSQNLPRMLGNAVLAQTSAIQLLLLFTLKRV